MANFVLPINTHVAVTIDPWLHFENSFRNLNGKSNLQLLAIFDNGKYQKYVLVC
jgi:hypothetical protein